LYMVFNSLKLSSSAGKPLWVDLCVHSRHMGGFSIKGGTQIRTGDGGFADLCLTTWLCCHSP
jgi:hypothetical protein